MANDAKFTVNTTPDNNASVTMFSTFIELEARARQSEDEEVFGFKVVNESLNLIPYRQAILWRSDIGDKRGKVMTVSGLAVPDKTSPFIRWVNKLCQYLAMNGTQNEATLCSAKAVSEKLAAEWAQWLPSHGLWLPLKRQNGEFLGGLLLSREEPWKDNERYLLNYLADSYGHVWAGLRPDKSKLLKRGGRRKWWMVTFIVLLILACLPVYQSALAPAEVVALRPDIVGAPVDGVIDSFAVEPNQMVKKGQELLRLDSTELDSRLEVAEKTLEIARAEYRQASQKAVFDNASRVDLAILKGKMEQAQTEVNYVNELLDRIVIRASREGLVIFDDINNWLGRPVKTGERIMQIADPSQVEIELHLPVADAIKLAEGAPVKLFLNVEPHKAVEAQLRYASYEADSTPEGYYAYRLIATPVEIKRGLRIGLKGTAKVYGERTLLIFYLLKRPFSSLRQTFGL